MTDAYILWIVIAVLGFFKTFFEPQFSRAASVREREEEAYSFFLRYIEECEGRNKVCKCGVGHIQVHNSCSLRFLTCISRGIGKSMHAALLGKDHSCD